MGGSVHQWVGSGHITKYQLNLDLIEIIQFFLKIYDLLDILDILLDILLKPPEPIMGLFSGKCVFTGDNEVVAKVMFLLLSVILSTGGVSASVHAGVPPLGQTPPGSRHPPRADTPPPRSRHPQSRHPLGADTPPPTPQEQTLLGADTPQEQTPPQSIHTPPKSRHPPQSRPPRADTPCSRHPLPLPRKHTPAYGQRAALKLPTGMHSCFFEDQ